LELRVSPLRRRFATTPVETTDLWWVRPTSLRDMGHPGGSTVDVVVPHSCAEGAHEWATRSCGDEAPG
jgi:hypothetical protein